MCSVLGIIVIFFEFYLLHSLCLLVSARKAEEIQVKIQNTRPNITKSIKINIGIHDRWLTSMQMHTQRLRFEHVSTIFSQKNSRLLIIHSSAAMEILRWIGRHFANRAKNVVLGTSIQSVQVMIGSNVLSRMHKSPPVMPTLQICVIYMLYLYAIYH